MARTRLAGLPRVKPSWDDGPKIVECRNIISDPTDHSNCSFDPTLVTELEKGGNLSVNFKYPTRHLPLLGTPVVLIRLRTRFANLTESPSTQPTSSVGGSPWGFFSIYNIRSGLNCWLLLYRLVLYYLFIE